jgi:hypothetical protein
MVAARESSEQVTASTTGCCQPTPDYFAATAVLAIKRNTCHLAIKPDLRQLCHIC